MSIIVVGKNERLLVQVLLGVRSYSDTKCIVLGGAGTGALRWSSLCAKYKRVGFDSGDDDAYVAAIANIDEPMQQLTLIPADCEAQRITNRVRHRLKVHIIPTVDTETLDMLDDKWQFYKFCDGHGFNVPATIFIGGKDNLDFDAVRAKLGIPFVIKPVSESGSFGVHIVHSSAYYDAAIRQNNKYNFKTLIAQQYIDGIDMGLDILSLHGKVSSFAIQERHAGGVSFLPDPYLEKIVHEFCAAIDYHGVINIDVRRESNKGKAYLIEANPRFWVTHSAAVWNGMNFVADCIEKAQFRCVPMMLTAGEFHDRRHPLFRPSWWRPLACDPGARGRILQAMMFDRYLMSRFAVTLPIRIWRYARRCLLPEEKSRPSV